MQAIIDPSMTPCTPVTLSAYSLAQPQFVVAKQLLHVVFAAQSSAADLEEEAI
jgi:hypothetical protein